MTDPDTVVRAVERALDEFIEHQRKKVGLKAQELLPDCSWEEMMNPDGVPALRNDPIFNYEDGILAGAVAVQIALRASVLGPLRRGEPLEPEGREAPR